MLSVPRWPEPGLIRWASQSMAEDVRRPTGTGRRLAARGNGGGMGTDTHSFFKLYAGFDSEVRHCQGVQYIQTSRTPFQSFVILFV